jgi:hypothetical protein
VPNYRGLFLRGVGSRAHAQNNGSAIAYTTTTHSSGAFGAIQGDAIRNVVGRAYSSSHFGLWRGAECEDEALGLGYGWSGALYCGGVSSSVPQGGEGGSQSQYFGINISRVVPTDAEIRPANTAVRYLIRALP